MSPRFYKIMATVATSTALVAGCNVAPSQVKDAVKIVLTAAQTEVGKQIVSQVASSLQAYTDIDVSHAVADTQAGLSAFDSISPTQGYSIQATVPVGSSTPTGTAGAAAGTAAAQAGTIAAAAGAAARAAGAQAGKRPPQLKDIQDKLPPGVKDKIKERQGPPPNLNKAKDQLNKAFKNRPQLDKTKLIDFAKPKFEEHRKNLAQRVDKRLKKMKFDPAKDFESVTSTASLDPFGEVTVVSATQSLVVKNLTKKHVFERYYDENKILVRTEDDFTQTFGKGATMTVHRERTNFDDGSFEVIFDSTTKGKDGKTRTVSWTRKGTADGTETGEGKITRKDGTSSTVTVTKDGNGKTVTKTKDDATKTDVEITQTEGDPNASVTTSDSTDPTKKTTESVDTEELDPSDS